MPGEAKGAFCTECGAGITPGAKFCQSCGHPTKPEAAIAPAPSQPAPPTRAAPPRRKRRIWPWGLAGALLVIIIASASSGGGKSSSSSSSAPAGPSLPKSESEARAYIEEHGDDAKRVAVNVEIVQLQVGRLAKSETETLVNELAQSAREAHDNLDSLRNNFASGSYDGEVEQAAVKIFSSADSLKNAMGAMVAYTGNPNPATLAHFSTQYTPAKGEWNEGISAMWRLAHKSHPPTI
jgi:hypothetical protein